MSSPSPRPGPPRPGRRSRGASARSSQARSWSTPRSGSAATPRRSSRGALGRTWSESTATCTRSSSPVSGWRPSAGRTTLVHAVYDEIPEVLADLGIGAVQGVLFDLGRLLHAARPARARLRVRRGRPAGHADGRHRGLTAAEVLNTYQRRRPGQDPALLRRGEVRPPDRPGRSSGSARARRSTGRRDWSTCSAP